MSANELEYGIIERSGSSQRRTRAVFEPEIKHRHEQWVASYPTMRPVEDWVEENVFVQPDEDIILQRNRLEAQQIAKSGQSVKKNKSTSQTLSPEEKAERADKRRRKLQLIAEMRAAENAARKIQIEAEKPAKLAEFQDKMIYHLRYLSGMSLDLAKIYIEITVALTVGAYRDYLEGLKGIDVAWPSGMIHIRWEDIRKAIPTVTITTTTWNK